jgi:uncharacterized protein YjbJ (UPF0337 family)
MSNNPDEIRANIEATRRDLGSDVDALADKVTPSKIVGRQTDKIKDALGSARDRVMGTASDLKDSSTGNVSDAAGAAKSKIQGNPLAVGLIVFGAAWLLSSLAPASAKEKQVAAQVKDAAQPLVENITESAKGAAQNLKGPVTDAANAIKDTATEGASHVKDEATSAASDVKDQAAEAKENLQQQG